MYVMYVCNYVCMVWYGVVWCGVVWYGIYVFMYVMYVCMVM